MQFQIPQFIETEDKIVGPFSLRQFLYAGGAAGISMMLYFIVSFWTWLPIAMILMAIGVGFAFVKINGRPLSVIAFSAAQFFWRPRLYLWQTEAPSLPIEEVTGKKVSLENIVAGLSLNKSWQRVQTGTIESNEKTKRSLSRLKEKYQVFEKITGERQAAKRIDYH